MLSVFTLKAQQQSFKQTLDSIQKLRRLSINTDFDSELRIAYALKSSELAHQTKVDTIILRSDQRVAWVYLAMSRYKKTQEWSHKNLKLAKKLKDSSAMAFMNHYLGYSYDYQKAYNDSAYYYYYNAIKFFNSLKRKRQEADVLLNLSILQESNKDYIYAEQNVFRAIRLIQTLPETERNLNTLLSLYNLVGTISLEFKNYNKALEYYNKTIEITKKQSNTSNIYTNNLYVKINIALTYKEKKEYKKAIHIYKELLQDTEMYHKDPVSYAGVLNNLGEAKFFKKGPDDEILSLYKRAYHISDSLDAKLEITYFGNDLSEFYLSLHQKDSALHYSKRSYKLAKQINENEEVLRSLKLLSQAIEGETGKQYLYEYIKLNDSLITKERIARNKFALIQFETDEITEERDKVTKQKSLLFGISITLVVMLALAYLVFVQRSKNRKLLFEREQQKANESIYSLMLQQQSILEQGRTEERFRISEELHDGILSKLFGTRMGLGLLSKKISGDASVLKKHSDFINQMQEIETEIRDVSHALKNKLLSSTVDFVAIIEYYIKGLSELHLFDYNVYANPEIPWSTINDQIKVNLYRILQEGLQNIIKHAKASHVDVSFYIIDAHLELVIKDDGIGFDVKKQAKGIGLKNIKSRTQNLNGTLDIISNPDKGTLLTVRFPI
ncbi:two-component sensor histidine kinase [Flavobacteriaceae bacterium AU392]|nr:two-component sensor histidine kinase [Flavobacteriaceae bacterium]RKM84203.1 two-component sensor histidine kinase [Flavobacteriaceae bacterium AU392]